MTDTEGEDWKKIAGTITVSVEELAAANNQEEFMAKYMEKQKKAIREFSFQEEYCGLSPLTTGKRDPWYKRNTCKHHDRAMQALKDGHPDKTNMQTFASFTGDILSGMAEGLYMLVSGPLYWLIGGVGGMGRWSQLERRNAKARGEVYPSNTPED